MSAKTRGTDKAVRCCQDALETEAGVTPPTRKMPEVFREGGVTSLADLGTGAGIPVRGSTLSKSGQFVPCVTDKWKRCTR